MPFYNLKCSCCGNEFEKYAEISERNSIICPKCGNTKHETIFGGKSAAVILKPEDKPLPCPNAHVCGSCCRH